MGLFGRLFGPKGDCSLEEAARLIGTSPETVTALVDSGRLSAAGTDPLRFDAGEVERYIGHLEEHRRNMDDFYRAGEEMGLDD